jgi:hypothetical protein
MKYRNRIPEPETTISGFADSQNIFFLMPTDPRFFWHVTINIYANIDKFVNIRYIFLLARLAYSWLFQLAQMWKLLAPGVGLGDLLTPDNIQN